MSSQLPVPRSSPLWCDTCSGHGWLGDELGPDYRDCPDCKEKRDKFFNEMLDQLGAKK